MTALHRFSYYNFNFFLRLFHCDLNTIFLVLLRTVFARAAKQNYWNLCPRDSDRIGEEKDARLLVPGEPFECFSHWPVFKSFQTRNFRLFAALSNVENLKFQALRFCEQDEHKKQEEAQKSFNKSAVKWKKIIRMIWRRFKSSFYFCQSSSSMIFHKMKSRCSLNCLKRFELIHKNRFSPFALSKQLKDSINHVTTCYHFHLSSLFRVNLLEVRLN